jgi:hypothetical protein
MSRASPITILVNSCAPANFLGTTRCKFLIVPLQLLLSDLLPIRVRAGIRDGRDDYCVTASSWPMFLYTNLSCDQENLEKGLFKGSLLVKVSFFIVNIYIFLR